MYILARLVVVAIFIFGLNVFPMFMPPTWMVLTFFSLHYKLPFVLLVLTGAVSATLGRVLLWYLTKTQFRKFIPMKMKENFVDLGHYLERHKQLSLPIIILYCLTPIPSNHLFIAAGLAEVDITFIAACFFVWRLISYSLWVTTAHIMMRNLESLFQRHYSHWTTFAGEIVSLITLYLLSQIPWKKVLRMTEKSEEEGKKPPTAEKKS